MVQSEITRWANLQRKTEASRTGSLSPVRVWSYAAARRHTERYPTGFGLPPAYQRWTIHMRTISQAMTQFLFLLQAPMAGGPIVGKCDIQRFNALREPVHRFDICFAGD